MIVSLILAISMLASAAYAVVTCAVSVEVWELELSDVTVNGAPVDTLDEYQGLHFRLLESLQRDLLFEIDNPQTQTTETMEFRSSELPESLRLLTPNSQKEVRQ